ncbi:helix-turn-helix domain-containing protein [Bacillus thuringiensis]|uniref:Helix-turn-helix domain-containing protein n=1 Tax=Bacillus thuringiensis serovar andalousiensis TaxID=257985 RepID=A0A6H0TPK2_BACTU|nr:helix-turn-helix domain-containing protein [Bacillus thuringiensis]QIW22359.1 helix-turn-helix domain-containing protein [Bacillus thuringiensis serovar andalousiensis]
MIINKAYKFRIYPNQAQATLNTYDLERCFLSSHSQGSLQ